MSATLHCPWGLPFIVNTEGCSSISATPFPKVWVHLQKWTGTETKVKRDSPSSSPKLVLNSQTSDKPDSSRGPLFSIGCAGLGRYHCGIWEPCQTCLKSNILKNVLSKIVKHIHRVCVFRYLKNIICQEVFLLSLSGRFWSLKTSKSI